MRRLARALLAAAALTLAGAPAMAEAKAPQAQAIATRRILVMFHLPPPHYRADAHAGGGYGDRIGEGGRRRQALRVARAHGLKLVTGWPMPVVGVDCYVMEVPEGVSVAELAQRISQDRAVAWAEPLEVYRARGAAAPNDPLYPFQPAARAWRLAELHQIATGRGVRVAVVDSRVDRNHPDLARQVVLWKDVLDGGAGGPEAHGTEVAGVIAARADNRLGVVGVAPGSRLIALRACSETAGPGQVATLCDSFSLARALVFAIGNGAQVINLSLAGPASPVLAKLLDVALSRRIVVVAAYDPALAGGGFPASHRGVIAVSAEPEPAGRGVYVAPGRDVPTAQPGGGWGVVSGDSYAAAHVSGLVALVRERSPRSAAPAFASGASGVIDPCATLAQSLKGRVTACLQLASPRP